MIPHVSPDSTHRGFVEPGSSRPFSLDTIPGFDQGEWDIAPRGDEQLENFLQQYVAGIVGLDGNAVFPRWQAEPPELPPWGQDWAAVGILAAPAQGPWPVVVEDRSGEFAWLRQHVYLDVMASFYGPHCQSKAHRLRRGFGIAQNREALFINHMGFIEVHEPKRVPAYIRQRWVDRNDVEFTLALVEIETYPIKSFTSGQGVTLTDSGYASPWTAPWPIPPLRT